MDCRKFSTCGSTQLNYAMEVRTTVNNRMLAELAGVSPATVSKVFSGSREISVVTAERVKRIAAECGYVPQKCRPLHTRIAVLVPEIHSPHYADKAALAHQLLTSHGITPDIRITGFSTEEITAHLRALSEDGITSGILALTENVTTAPRNIPTVFYSRDPMSDNAGMHRGSDYCTGCVYMDCQFYLKQILNHLIRLGHTRIGYIGDHLAAGKQRMIHDTMRACGLTSHPEDFFNSDDRFYACGSTSVGVLLERLRTDPSYVLPSAFVCAYDEIAIGAIRTFTEAGIRVPEDVSVIGINDIASAEYCAVPLTTVRTYTEESMTFAVDLLLELLAEKERRTSDAGSPMPRMVELETTLIVRKSSGRARSTPLTGADYQKLMMKL